MQTARTARTILIHSFCRQAKQGTWQQEFLATAAPPKLTAALRGTPAARKAPSPASLSQDDSEWRTLAARIQNDKGCCLALRRGGG